MQPLVDPAAWTADEAQGRVALELPDQRPVDADELEAAVAAVRLQRRRYGRHRKDDFPLKAFADGLTDVRRELTDGRGIVMMQDFPLDRFDREGAAHRLYRAGRPSRADECRRTSWATSSAT